MAGLLDAIAGSNDPSTADPATGLLESQRRQLAFNALGQTGALLLAAGQPMMPGQNANILAQLGNVGGNVQTQASQMGQQNAMNQRTVAEQRKNAQQEELMKYTQTPEFQKAFADLPPAQKAVATAMLKSGDVQGVLKTLHEVSTSTIAAQKEARLAAQPKFNADGTIYFPDSGDIIDPIRGTRTNARDLKSAGGTPGANTGTIATDNAGPTGEAFLSTVAPGYGNYLKNVAEGRETISPMLARTAAGQKILMDLNRYEPGFDQTKYQERQAFRKSVTSGPLFNNVVAPANKIINHGEEYLNKYDQLGMEGGVASYITNNLKWADAKASRTGAFMAAEENLNTFKKEFEKMMAGKGQLTDEARRTMNGLTPTSSPQETYAVINTMVNMMKGQVDPVEEQKKQTMGKSMPEPLIQERGQKFLEHVAAGPPGQRQQGAPAAAPPAQGSTGQVAPGQTAPPPGGFDPKYDYRAKPDGTWQRKLKQ